MLHIVDICLALINQSFAQYDCSHQTISWANYNISSIGPLGRKCRSSLPLTLEHSILCYPSTHLRESCLDTGGVSKIKIPFFGIGIPIIKRRRSYLYRGNSRTRIDLPNIETVPKWLITGEHIYGYHNDKTARVWALVSKYSAPSHTSYSGRTHHGLDLLLVIFRKIPANFRSVICRAAFVHLQTNFLRDWPEIRGRTHYGPSKAWWALPGLAYFW